MDLGANDMSVNVSSSIVTNLVWGLDSGGSCTCVGARGI